MKDYFLKIFNYGHWSNEVIYDTLSKKNIGDDYISLMMSHILNTQFIWLNRIEPAFDNPYSMWEVHKPEKWKEMNDEVTELYVSLVTGKRIGELNAKIQNVNMSGEVFFNSLADILIHIANHAAHHRGQISLRIRKLGVDPPNYNYITYVRSFPDFW